MKSNTATFAARANNDSVYSGRPGSDDCEAVFDGAGTAAAVPQTPQEELAAYLKKSIGEKIRDAVVKEMGLSEAALAAMPFDKRIATEDAIISKLKEKLLHGEHSTQYTGQALLAMVAFASDAKKRALGKA